MDNESLRPDDPKAVASALRALDADRNRLGNRMKAPRWYGPVCGLFVAALLFTPMIDAAWLKPVPLVLAIVAGFGLENLNRRVVGVTKRGFAGPASAGTVIAMVGSAVLLYCAASLFEGMGMPLAVAGVAALGFAIMWVLVAVNGRAVAWDLRRAG